jgi:hypothetical protein
MTWGDWVNSSFNFLNATIDINNGQIKWGADETNNGYYIGLLDSITYVKSTDLIIADYHYYSAIPIETETTTTTEGES